MLRQNRLKCIWISMVGGFFCCYFLRMCVHHSNEQFCFLLGCSTGPFLSMSASHYCSCLHPPHLFHRSHTSPSLHQVGCYMETSQGAEEGLRACSTHPIIELRLVQEGGSSVIPARHGLCLSLPGWLLFWQKGAHKRTAAFQQAFWMLHLKKHKEHV